MTRKNKTAETKVNVTGFINSYANNEQKKLDSFRLIALLREWSGFEPKMWGPTMIGFGRYHYKYASGHEGDAPLAAFSPRKDAIVVYVAPSFSKKEELLKKLGKHKASVSCVYVKNLEAIDIATLKKLITHSIKHAKSLYN